MKKLNVVLIVAAMSLALCACGTEATGSMSITETGEQQTQTKKPSYLELDKVLDEINTEIKQLPDEANETGSSVDPSWEDVVELVNLRGDKTTVYLLADGRYMDRTSTVYIFDGADTWTDESGLEWNKAVR